ncbi:MAG TPA: DUF2892 domain-containing protein [Epsilonproteobacteria bacterium]|nr:DUF2892 domain-containing protein [Campylobacterota bacterium]HHD79582.1 DUF2892 domain-containing protein [Campylobacterota bacterium]
MVCNVGKIDRIVRLLIAIVLIIWGLTAKYLMMLIVGVSLLFTALSGWCIIYALLKLDTGCQKKKN